MKQLRWIQPSAKRRAYELHDGERTIAQLEYRGWKQEVHIKLDQEELVVRPRGFWQAQLEIMRGDQPIAAYNAPDARKQLVFMTGRRFQWQSLNFWSTRSGFRAPDNQVLMIFKYQTRWLRSEALVELTEGSEKYPELRVLLAFGWVLMMRAGAAA